MILEFSPGPCRHLEVVPSSGCSGTAHISQHQRKWALKSFLSWKSVGLEMWAGIVRKYGTGFLSVALVDS